MQEKSLCVRVSQANEVCTQSEQIFLDILELLSKNLATMLVFDVHANRFGHVV